MRTFVGIVVRTNNAKTAHVEVQSEWVHPKYLKKVRQTKVFACHDTIGVNVGDEVEISETKRLSATKYFMVGKVTKEKAVNAVTLTAAKTTAAKKTKSTKKKNK